VWGSSYGDLKKKMSGTDLPVMYETSFNKFNVEEIADVSSQSREYMFPPSIPVGEKGIRERESKRKKKEKRSKAGERLRYSV